MKIDLQPLSEEEHDVLLDMLRPDLGFQLFQRVVAGKRDAALIEAAQLQVKADQFPVRAEEAKKHFEDAARYNHFLEVVDELTKFAEKTPRAFTVVKVKPTALREIEFKE